MDVTVREMISGDWDAVQRIYQDGIDTGIATFQPEVPPFAEWDRVHLPFCRLVAVASDIVIGFAVLMPVSARAVYAGVAEVSIYIAPEYAGKGAGTILLNALIAASERHGIWMLQSGILSGNVASVRLHEKCGFRLVGYREKIGCDRYGTWRDVIFFERRSHAVAWEESAEK
ncbi:MAG: GNAT family N-acetyltransferase [Methanocalculaceae archaeon]|jgi:phosphinothricin acetyltransferase|nr:GNAT family N-acetyltransferase [Methanocalculaceae archaeon]